MVTEQPWPFPTAAAQWGQLVNNDLRCVALSPSEVSDVISTVSSLGVTFRTAFEQDGVFYQIAWRPLAPHETACSD